MTISFKKVKQRNRRQRQVQVAAATAAAAQRSFTAAHPSILRNTGHDRNNIRKVSFSATCTAKVYGKWSFPRTVARFEETEERIILSHVEEVVPQPNEEEEEGVRFGHDAGHNEPAEPIARRTRTTSTSTFESFGGDFNERGMYSLGDTEIVSNGKNGGWAMFWARIFFTLVFGTSVAVTGWMYKAEHGHWPFFPPDSMEDSKDSIAVHRIDEEEEEVMEERRIVLANGLLGLKGHHPSAASNENSHPNSVPRHRKRIGAKDSPFSCDTSAFSPNSQATSSSRHPLGIRSMTKLNSSFFTPQKPKSSRQMVLYDAERLTKSDEKSVKSNVVLFD